MRLFVCSVMDSAVQAYAPPIYFRSEGEAIRSFAEACKTERGFVSNPEDYHFYQIGYFDDVTGQFLNLPSPKLLASALTVGAVDRDNSPG